ncbi:AAA family ATPase, partial [bacterium]|nr:AAA family ATPase [bacterium]
EVVCAEGLITGGAGGSAEAELLRRKERVAEAERDVQRLEREFVEATEREREASDALEGLTMRARECGVSTEQSEADLWEAKRHLTEFELARTSAAERVQELRVRRDALGERMSGARAEIGSLAEQLGRLSKGEDELGERLEDLQRRFAEVERQREKGLEAQRVAELDAASADAVLEQLQGQLRELKERAGAADAAIERKSGERTDHAEVMKELAAKIEEDARVLEELAQTLQELTTHRDHARDETRRLRTRLDEVEGTSRAARGERDEMQRELHEIELRDTELKGRGEALRDRVLEDYSVDVGMDQTPAQPEGSADELVVDDGVETEHHVALMLDEGSALPDGTDWEETRHEVERLKARLRSMGPVNLLALDEYDEESRRLEFLQAQYEDLERSRTSLAEAISEINKAARDVFVTTFEEVRKHFVTVFQRLFEGGEADLRLIDPSDPLESPIEIVASPREKKLGRLSLLSGGERALTAIALLFAIYLVKPSPFCILDEVDAPLDDANVRRFIKMLREFAERTQFIIITHNKVTMQAADRLYGVTMEESGVSKVVSVRLDAVGNEVEREEIAYEAV